MKRSYSLKRHKEFRYVYRSKQSVACRSLAMVYRHTGGDSPRIGFSVSKKVGGSVVRNRVKRRLREAVTPMIPDMNPAFCVIFIARTSIVNDSYSEICDAVKKLLKKARIVQ